MSAKLNHNLEELNINLKRRLNYKIKYQYLLMVTAGLEKLVKAELAMDSMLQRFLIFIRNFYIVKYLKYIEVFR